MTEYSGGYKSSSSAWRFYAVAGAALFLGSAMMLGAYALVVWACLRLMEVG